MWEDNDVDLEANILDNRDTQSTLGILRIIQDGKQVRLDAEVLSKTADRLLPDLPNPKRQGPRPLQAKADGPALAEPDSSDESNRPPLPPCEPPLSALHLR
jgi:hypothetical protein